MKFNFTKFDDKGTNYKGGLSVGTTVAYVMEKDFPQYKRIDVLLDAESNAIKIVEGKRYKFAKKYMCKSRSYHLFNSKSMITHGVKKGWYSYQGDGVFVLAESRDL